MKQKLFNPFIQIAGAKALGIGLVFLVISSLLAGFFNTRFDGVLDAHFVKSNQLYIPFAENVINVTILSIFFYLFAILLAKGKIRFIDILGTVTFSRLPFIFIPLFNIGNINGRIGDKIMDSVSHSQPIALSAPETIFLTISTIITLLLIVWYVVLLYRAYAICTNLKGAKMITSFIAGLLLAEICSSILIHFTL